MASIDPLTGGLVFPEETSEEETKDISPDINVQFNP
jgi:hypothetical protein